MSVQFAFPFLGVLTGAYAYLYLPRVHHSGFSLASMVLGFTARVS